MTEEQILVEFEKLFRSIFPEGMVFSVADGDPRDLETRVRDLFRTSLHRYARGVKDEAIKIIEDAKIDMKDPKNFMTAIVNEDMAVTDFPQVLNKILSDLQDKIKTNEEK